MNTIIDQDAITVVARGDDDVMNRRQLSLANADRINDKWRQLIDATRDAWPARIPAAKRKP